MKRATLPHVAVNVGVRPASQSAGGTPDAHIRLEESDKRLVTRVFGAATRDALLAKIVKRGRRSKQQSLRFQRVTLNMDVTRPRSIWTQGHVSSSAVCPKLVPHPVLVQGAPLMARKKSRP